MQKMYTPSCYGSMIKRCHLAQDVGAKNSTIFIPSNPGHVGDLSAEASSPLHSVFANAHLLIPEADVQLMG